MKKIYLFLFTLITCISSQGQVLFYEDFDGIPGPTAGGAGTYVFPAGWFLRNVDNRTPNAQTAYVNEAWERREDFGSNVTDSVAFSNSYYAPVGAADDWMWTPLVGPIPANTILSWQAKAYDGTYPDGYEVRIITAPTMPNGGTGVLGNQVSASTQIFSTAAENSFWTTHEISLDAYIGQSVYIGFRNNSNDKFLLVIDDIKVEVVRNYDVRLVTKTRPSQYGMIPLSQTSPIPVSGLIQNIGLDTVNNVILRVEMTNASNQIVFSDSSAAYALLPGETDTFIIDSSFTPSAPGKYIIKYFSSAEMDEDSSNNMLIDSIFVSDSMYARDMGAITGTLGIGANGIGYMGQDFDIFNEHELTSIDITYTRGYPGEKMAAVIWSMNANGPDVVIATTDTLVYPDDSARTYNLNIHGGSVNLLPGKYAVTAVEFDSTLAIALTNDIFIPGTTWVDWPANPITGWGNNEDYGSQFAKTYMIRPILGVICTLNGIVDSISNPKCAGSNDGMIMISAASGNGPLHYQWIPNVSDTTIATGLTAGEYKVVITDSTSCVDTMVITLTDPPAVDVSTTTMNNVIVANANGATYQWINCANNTPIANATNKIFTATQSGSYAVIVTFNGCKDTSACVNIVITGIEHTSAGDLLEVYPNPNNGRFTIKTAPVESTYKIYNELGQEVRTFILNKENNFMLTIDDLSKGVYVISGEMNGQQVNQRLVVY